MLLRLVASRAIRCFPRPQLLVTGKRCLERRICTVQHNLKPVTSNFSAVYHLQYRNKRTGVKTPRRTEEESDSDDDERKDGALESTDKEYEVEPGAKIISYKFGSPRVDRLVRKALNISGKDFLDLFYSKKIQLNGEVLIKKSRMVDKGDIITVPLGETSGKTARGAVIEILEVIENKNDCSVKVSRNKNTFVNI